MTRFSMILFGCLLAGCATAGAGDDDDNDDNPQPAGPDASPGTPTDPDASGPGGMDADAAPGSADAAPGSADAGPGDPDGAVATCADEGSPCVSDNPCVSVATIQCHFGVARCEPLVFETDGTTCGSGICDGSGFCELTSSDIELNDKLGTAVDLDGDIAVIGAAYDDTDVFLSGSAYVLEREAGVWMEAGRLEASDRATFDEFGHAVAVSGTTIAVGTPDDDDRKGSVYMAPPGLSA